MVEIANTNRGSTLFLCLPLRSVALFFMTHILSTSPLFTIALFLAGGELCAGELEPAGLKVEILSKIQTSQILQHIIMQQTGSAASCSASSRSSASPPPPLSAYY